MYDNMFGFLFNFKKLQLLSDYVLKTYCVNLKNALKHDTHRWFRFVLRVEIFKRSFSRWKNTT